jgi:glutamate racemase
MRRLEESYPAELTALLSCTVLQKGVIELCSTLGVKNLPRLTSWTVDSQSITDQKHVHI